MATILIIDGYQPLLRLYAKEFRREGYQVLTTNNLADAIYCIQNHAIDAVILEIGTLDREEFYALVKNLTQDKKVPIIINTGEISQALDQLKPRVDAWVAKSADLDPLKKSVRTLRRQAYAQSQYESPWSEAERIGCTGLLAARR